MRNGGKRRAPSAEVKEMTPPIRSRSTFVIANPRPVPALFVLLVLVT